MERSLYKIGSGDLAYYDVFDEDGEYYGYFMMDIDDMLMVLVDELLDDMMDQN